jgi:hypothetical protein
MTFSSCRRAVWAMVVLLAAIVAVVPPSVALAQAPPGQAGQAPPVTRTEARNADDCDSWGLLDLVWLVSPDNFVFLVFLVVSLGLVGLARLLRRAKARSVIVADRPDRR